MKNLLLAVQAAALGIGLGLALLTLGLLVGFFPLDVYTGGLLGLAVLAPLLTGGSYLQLRWAN